MARVAADQAGRARRRYSGATAYAERDPGAIAIVDLAGARSLVVVPMLKDDELVGVIAIYRQEVRPFTDKQIELVQELRRAGGDRHREHAAAQRIAPAHRRSHRGAGAADRDLGGAAASSPARPASWSRCSRPCWRTPRAFARPSSARCACCEGDAFRTVALHNAPPAYAEFAAARAVDPAAARTSRLAALPRPKQVVHIADIRPIRPTSNAARAQSPSPIGRRAIALSSCRC